MYPNAPREQRRMVRIAPVDVEKVAHEGSVRTVEPALGAPSRSPLSKPVVGPDDDAPVEQLAAGQSPDLTAVLPAATDVAQDNREQAQIVQGLHYRCAGK